MQYETKKGKLSSVLRNRKCRRKYALSIARDSGWEKEVVELGEPGGK
jgi:hypothetical protein